MRVVVILACLALGASALSRADALRKRAYELRNQNVKPGDKIYTAEDLSVCWVDDATECLHSPFFHA